MGLLDFLFPKYCVSCKKLGSYLCADCFSKVSFDVLELCLVCGKGAIGGITHPYCQKKHTINGTYTGVKYTKSAQKLIYVLKYRPFVSDVVTVICELLYEALIQKESFLGSWEKEEKTHILVPIPLSKEREIKRGYNQAKLIAQGLGKYFNIPVIDVLVRIKPTVSQVGLSKEERKTNITGAFAINEQTKMFLKDKIVFLVDDVLTTGATMQEAAKVLKQSGVEKVYGIAFARD